MLEINLRLKVRNEEIRRWTGITDVLQRAATCKAGHRQMDRKTSTLATKINQSNRRHHKKGRGCEKIQVVITVRSAKMVLVWGKRMVLLWKIQTNNGANSFFFLLQIEWRTIPCPHCVKNDLLLFKEMNRSLF